MTTPRVFKTLTMTLIVAACAGPTTTNQPASTAESTLSSRPTLSRTASAPPASPSDLPATDLPSTPGATPTETAAPASPTNAPAGWTERSDVAPGPSGREDHTWTVSGDGSTAYLFAGRGAAGAVLDDLWQFDLATDTWTELQPTTDGPAGRFGHTATWVPDVGLVIWSGQGARFFDDIWRYDPAVNAWEELPSLGAVPAARYGSCASLGPDGELWISHGFTQDDGRFADTRSYDFASGTWTDRTPTGDLPVQRCLHDCFWSSAGELVLYGGQTTGVLAIGDLWALDSNSGEWSQAQADAGIQPRNLYAVALDGDRAVVFGGGSADGGFLGDSWWLDTPTLVATPAEFESAPGARSSATLINDSARGRYLLFGGMNEDGVLDDMWELSPA